MQDNRQSNAIYLGQFIAGIMQPSPEDQYMPTDPLFFEEFEQEPDQEEMPDEDRASQKIDYEL